MQPLFNHDTVFKKLAQKEFTSIIFGNISTPEIEF